MKKKQHTVFTLKCKDISICDVVITDGNITKITDIYHKEFAPIEAYIFENIHLDRLNNWFSSRAIPVERDGYKHIISELNIQTNKQYLLDNLALSLSDQYWLKPKELDLHWSDINFFENDYNIIKFSDATFGKDNNISSSFKKLHTHYLRTPNASLGGMLKKMWIQKDKVNYLIKGSNSLYNIEPINEVLASKICKVIQLDCAEYALKELKGKRTNQLVCICKDIVDSSQHIVSAYSLVLGFPEQKIDSYDSYMTFLEDVLCIPNVKADIQKMLMLDYIMLNEDRHLNNFAVIRDSDSFSWKKICPIYDTGKSLNTAINEEYWDFQNGEVKSFEGEMVHPNYLMKFINIPINQYQINLIKELGAWYKDTLIIYQDILKLKDSLIDNLYEGFMERVSNFEDMMISKNLVIVSEEVMEIEDEYEEDDLEIE